MPNRLPPEIESRIVRALELNNPDGAIAIMRTIDPQWGRGRTGDMFGLRLDPAILRFITMAEPPQIERFSQDQRKRLRIAAVMQYFIGGETGSERWIPDGVEWKSKSEAMIAVRMCKFWGISAFNFQQAKDLGFTRKNILGPGQRGEMPHARCDYCISIWRRGFIEIDSDFEPGIKFPPLRGCTHPKYSCRCDVEYAK